MVAKSRRPPVQDQAEPCQGDTMPTNNTVNVKTPVMEIMSRRGGASIHPLPVLGIQDAAFTPPTLGFILFLHERHKPLPSNICRLLCNREHFAGRIAGKYSPSAAE